MGSAWDAGWNWHSGDTQTEMSGPRVEKGPVLLGIRGQPSPGRSQANSVLLGLPDRALPPSSDTLEPRPSPCRLSVVGE